MDSPNTFQSITKKNITIFEEEGVLRGSWSSAGKKVHFDPENISCGVLGNESHATMIQQISSLAQLHGGNQWLILKSTPKDDPKKLWVFSATHRKSPDCIKRGKKYFSQKRYDVAKDSFTEALKYERKEGNGKELQLAIEKVNKMMNNPYATCASSYDEAHDCFLAHVRNELVNRFVFEELKKKIAQFSNEVPLIVQELTEEKIARFFSDLSLPPDTRALLDDFFSKICEQIQTASSNELEVQKRQGNIRGHLDQLSTLKRSELPTWSELDLFLNIHEIKIVPNVDAKDMLDNIINEDDPEALRKFLKSCLGEEKVRKVDLILEKTLYRNYFLFSLESFVADLINTRPKKKKEEKILLVEHLKGQTGDMSHLMKSYSLKCFSPNPHLPTQPQAILKCVCKPNGCISIQTTDGFSYLINGVRSQFIVTHHFPTLLYQSIYLGTFPDHTKVKIEGDPKFQELFGNESYKLSVNYVKERIKSIELSSENASYTLTSDEEYFSSRSANVLVKNNGKVVDRFPFELFSNRMKALVTSTKKITGNPKNICKIFLISQMREYEQKEQFKKQIEIKEKELIEFLIQEQFTLNKLLDNYISNKCRSIQGEVTLDCRKNDLITELINLYQEKFNITYSRETYLSKLVAQANYGRMINSMGRDENIEIAQVMDLLKSSDKHLEKIRGQAITVFIGQTGSGKSATIGYLMGAKMEYGSNRIGQQTVRLKNTHDKADNFLFPEIGHSIGISKTLNAAGYPVKIDQPDGNRAEHLFVDCAGFCENRGVEHELCANLSIDRAVDACKEVTSVVLVVPLAAITDSARGNQVVETIMAVRERFPKITNEHIGSFHLLITRHVDSIRQKVDKLRDGTTFQEFLDDCQKVRNPSEVQRIREEVWQALVHLQKQGQVRLVDIKAQGERFNLIKQFMTAPQGASLKASYKPAIERIGMLDKFGETVQAALFAWRRLAEKYHESVEKTDRCREQIKGYEKKTLDMKETQKTIVDALVGDKLQVNQMKTLIPKLDSIDFDKKESLEAQFLDDGEENSMSAVQLKQSEIPSEVQGILDQIKESIEQRLNRAKELIEAYRKELKACKSEEENLNRELADITKKTVDSMNDINEATAKLTLLKQGSTKESLWSMGYKKRWKKGDKFQIVHWKSKKIEEQRFKNFSNAKDEDICREKTLIIGEYEGELSYTAFIEREYRIVPKDPEMLKHFLKYFEGGDYKALIDGEHYRPNFSTHVDASGRKIAYSFIATFGKDQIPWIEISHEIKNEKLNKATIKNIRIEIDENERKIRDNGESIENFKKNLEDCTENIQLLEENIAREMHELEKAQSEIIQGIDQAKELCRSTILETENKIAIRGNELEKNKKSVEDLQNNIKEEKRTLVKLKQRNVHYALVWQEKGRAICPMLRSFCDILNQKDDIYSSRSDLRKEITQFIDAYNNLDQIFEFAARDLSAYQESLVASESNAN